MLNETNSELQERSDEAAIEEMMERTDVQLPAPLYRLCFDETYTDQLIEEQQQIEAREWNEH